MLGLKQQSVTTVFQPHKDLLCCNCPVEDNKNFVHPNTLFEANNQESKKQSERCQRGFPRKGTRMEAQKSSLDM
jgi:hypothetical protein